MNELLIVLIIALKVLIPIGITRKPFWFAWANFVLDTIDGDLLIPLGLSDPIYQNIDKGADWLTYVAMAVTAWRMRWVIRNWIYALFGLRTVGQIAFFLTSDERVFFLFPNFLEPLFLIYATALLFKKTETETAAWYQKYRIPIWLFVVVYKMQDEYITHIGNVDRSDLIQRIFG